MESLQRLISQKLRVVTRAGEKEKEGAEKLLHWGLRIVRVFCLFLFCLGKGCFFFFFFFKDKSQTIGLELTKVALAVFTPTSTLPQSLEDYRY